MRRVGATTTAKSSALVLATGCGPILTHRRWLVNGALLSDREHQRKLVDGAESDHAVNLWRYAQQRQKDAIEYATFEQEQLLKEMREHRDYESLVEDDKYELAEVWVAVDDAGNEVKVTRNPRQHTDTTETGSEFMSRVAEEDAKAKAKDSMSSSGNTWDGASGDVATTNKKASESQGQTEEMPELPPGAVKWEKQQRKVPRDRPYVRSAERFDRHVTLNTNYSGAAENRIMQRWETLWFNYIRYYFTEEILIGKDRFGTRFFVKWNSYRTRSEARLARRRDKKMMQHAYGNMHTDDRVWARWARFARQDPPTVAEEEFRRRKILEKAGPMSLGDETVENMMMRQLSTLGFGPNVNELDPDEELGGPLDRSFEPVNRNPEDELKTREAEKRATWTDAFVKGDLFYNEQEVQSMRQELGHVFRDKQWLELEVKRQLRQKYEGEAGARRKPNDPVYKQDPIDKETGEFAPPEHSWENSRQDGNMPYFGGIADLTTPELERLRLETGQLEDERAATRKELGITDVGDFKEGRNPIDKGYGPFQPPPVSASWKPKVWSESWGTGGGNRW